MRTKGRRAVRQMPRIYGNLYETKRSSFPVFAYLKAAFWLVVFGGLMYGLFLAPWFRVREAAVEGNRYLSRETIEAAVPLGGSIWFFPSDQVETAILQHPTVASVAVFKGLPGKVKVVVEEREPQLVWQSGSRTAAIDTLGYAFSIDGQVLQDADIPLVVDASGLVAEDGQKIVDVAFVTFMRDLYSLVREYVPERPVERFEVRETTYDVTADLGGNLVVKFNSMADPGVQVRNLKRLLVENKAGDGSAVDLRIDRWGYVRN